MDAGSRTQMSTMGVPTPGLGQRRATQRITPLPLGELRASDVDAGAPTPRTSRSHLLAGLRTAPRTSTATNFPASPSVAAHGQHPAAFGRAAGAGAGADGYYNAPRTAHPFMGGGSLQQQAAMAGYTTQPMQQQQQQQQPQQPPEIRIQDGQDHVDVAHMASALLLAQQQQQIEQQLQALQLMAAQQQQQFFQARSDGSLSQQQRQQRMYAQQMQIAQLQNQLAAAQLPGMYAAYMDPNQAMLMAQMADAGVQGVPMAHLAEQQQQQQQQQQVHSLQHLQQLQQLQFQQQQQQQQLQLQHQQLYANQMQGNHANAGRAQGFRSGSPPKRFEPSADATPLPPPSANAFRRGHKKTPSLALGTALAAVQDAPRSAGPRTPSFPQSGHGPGQGRAGEHPTRQPRGPPSMDELVARPTSRHEGSKNFAARARRSAVSSLVRAGLDRRNGSSSSVSSASSSVAGGSGVSSPTLDSSLVVQIPSPAAVADGLVHSPVAEDSDSERSGSGSLAGDVDVECSLPSSRSSSSSTYGAIGSDRPSSRQKSRQSVDSVASVDSAGSAGVWECRDDDSNTAATTTSTFANVFKKASLPSKEQAGEARKAKLVLTRSGSSPQV